MDAVVVGDKEVVVEEVHPLSLYTAGPMDCVCTKVLIVALQQLDIKQQQQLTTAWVEAIAIAHQQLDGVGAKIMIRFKKIKLIIQN